MAIVARSLGALRCSRLDESNFRRITCVAGIAATRNPDRRLGQRISSTLRESRFFWKAQALAATNREGFVLASKAFPDNPYDGHTLAQTNQQIVRITGVEPERFYADKGFRGHDYDKPERVILSGRRRGLSPTMKRELKRRSAIEATIGHMKTDGRLDRNYLLGHAGDAVNALLCAAGHNLRLVLNHLRALFALILVALLGAEKRTGSAYRPNLVQI